MLGTDGHLAADDPAVGTEFGVQILVVPAQLLETFDVNRAALEVSVVGIFATNMLAERASSAHHAFLEDRVAVDLDGLLGILDGVEQDKSEVERLEQRPTDFGQNSIETYLLI